MSEKLQRGKQIWLNLSSNDGSDSITVGLGGAVDGGRLCGFKLAVAARDTRVIRVYFNKILIKLTGDSKSS